MQRRGGLVDDLVLRRSAVLEREVEARELELDADHVGREHAQSLLEQLLPGLVPFEDDDRPGVHAGILSEPRARSPETDAVTRCHSPRNLLRIRIRISVTLALAPQNSEEEFHG